MHCSIQGGLLRCGPGVGFSGFAGTALCGCCDHDTISCAWCATADMELQEQTIKVHWDHVPPPDSVSHHWIPDFAWSGPTGGAPAAPTPRAVLVEQQYSPRSSIHSSRPPRDETSRYNTSHRQKIKLAGSVVIPVVPSAHLRLSNDGLSPRNAPKVPASFPLWLHPPLDPPFPPARVAISCLTDAMSCRHAGVHAANHGKDNHWKLEHRSHSSIFPCKTHASAAWR